MVKSGVGWLRGVEGMKYDQKMKRHIKINDLRNGKQEMFEDWVDE